MKKEKKQEHFYDECPIVMTQFSSKQMGLYRLNGMCWVLSQFPDLKKTCPTCTFYKELPPKSFTCKRFYCTTEKAE